MSKPPLHGNKIAIKKSLLLTPENEQKTSPPKVSTATPPAIEKFIPKCKKLLGSGNSGTAVKQCYDEDCKNCRVVKTSIGSDREYREDFFREAAIDEEVQKAAKGTAYEKLVPKFYNYFDYKTSQVIETSWNPNEGTFRDYLDRNYSTMTTHTFARILVQVFSTLSFLHEKISFKHMDLKSDNVLIIKNDEPSFYTNFLPITAEVDGKYKKINLAVPYSNVSAMIIDFGNSYAYDGYSSNKLTFKGTEVRKNTIYSKGSIFNGKCDFQAFDVFRWLVDIYNLCHNHRTKPLFSTFLRTLITNVFGTFFDTVTKNSKSYNDGFQMLTANGCMELQAHMAKHGVITYASVAKIIADIPESGIIINFKFGKSDKENDKEKENIKKRSPKRKSSPKKSYLQRSLLKLRALFDSKNSNA